MSATWGIHNDQPSLDPIGDSFVSIGWDELGDLDLLGDKEAVKDAVARQYPDYKAGAIPVVAGTLLRFRDQVAIDDLVVYPDRGNSTVNIGRVTGPYSYQSTQQVHRSRRTVEWLRRDIPRDSFSQPALYEIGSSVTLFRVRNHESEFRAALDGFAAEDSPENLSEAVSPEAAVQQVETEPDAQRIEEHTVDYVLRFLHRVDPGDFERFVADLFRAMGYRARATQISGDGGVDVIAHRDLLGVEAPTLKVQCKRRTSTIGGPDVQALLGTLSGGSEIAVFVTLGGYSPDAIRIARSRHNLRLVSGVELVELVLDHYEHLPVGWKATMRLRRVYVVDTSLSSP